MDKKIILLVSALVIIFLGYLGGKSLYENQTREEYRFLATEKSELFVRDYSPRLGDVDAPVYLIEFLDPECESCRAFYPLVKKILKQFSDVQLVVRYAPFHGNSQFAVKILEATRKQNRYWDALEALFQNQPRWGSHHNPQPELIWEIIGSIGIDTEQIKKDMEDPSIAQIIKQDMEDLRTLGVRRTPTFFVNGVPLLDFSYDSLVQLVEQEIAAAKSK
tara:strand:+ start:104 stop:760 length:657 start_codon:yes stop_codon:yes gene_type:complete